MEGETGHPEWPYGFPSGWLTKTDTKNWLDSCPIKDVKIQKFITAVDFSLPSLTTRAQSHLLMQTEWLESNMSCPKNVSLSFAELCRVKLETLKQNQSRKYINIYTASLAPGHRKNRLAFLRRFPPYDTWLDLSEALTSDATPLIQELQSAERRDEFKKMVEASRRERASEAYTREFFQKINCLSEKIVLSEKKVHGTCKHIDASFLLDNPQESPPNLIELKGVGLSNQDVKLGLAEGVMYAVQDRGGLSLNCIGTFNGLVGLIWTIIGSPGPGLPALYGLQIAKYRLEINEENNININWEMERERSLFLVNNDGLIPSDDKNLNFLKRFRLITESKFSLLENEDGTQEREKLEEEAAEEEDVNECPECKRRRSE